MLATIKLTKFTRNVYEPSEDSFLLADALRELWENDDTDNNMFTKNLFVVDKEKSDYDYDYDYDYDDDDDEFLSVEIGVGSGYVLCGHILSYVKAFRAARERPLLLQENERRTGGERKKRWRFIGVDVNEEAVECTKETLRNHELYDDDEEGTVTNPQKSSSFDVEIIKGDLLEDERFFARGNESIAEETTTTERRIRRKIDVLLFNPPYVVTPSEEIYDEEKMKMISTTTTTATTSTDYAITAAWAGGVRGREVIDRILKDIKNILRENGGIFLCVAYEQNDIEEMMNVLREQDLKVDLVRRTKADEEQLSIIMAKNV